MTRWSRYSDEEIERRRQSSIHAVQNINREKFVKEYQERCDRLYWMHGKCCAGCDHWISDCSDTGQCEAAGIVSGEQVLKSIGITFSTWIPEPGFPYTRNDFVCGLFKDEFDWETLPVEYLKKIGAYSGNKIKQKPISQIARINRGEQPK